MSAAICLINMLLASSSRSHRTLRYSSVSESLIRFGVCFQFLGARAPLELASLVSVCVSVTCQCLSRKSFKLAGSY